MATEDEVIRVTSEEEALELLERALNGDIPENVGSLIHFDGWPNLNVYLPYTPVQASISPTMMEAFIETQTSLYRAYSLLATETGDLRGLSRVEREALEFRVEVKGGSSGYLADLAKPIETIGTNLVSKMGPTQTFIAVLTVALLVAGVISLKAWLKQRGTVNLAAERLARRG